MLHCWNGTMCFTCLLCTFRLPFIMLTSLASLQLDMFLVDHLFSLEHVGASPAPSFEELAEDFDPLKAIVDFRFQMVEATIR